ncbi:hypothetical protein B0H63DRAFT_485545 [Podospora didyma]|uniref:Uncharacterized protein n=1 Tax=Podospora didyma TaxID=330526 RepID=A0AAE0K9P6_9PEZI|nr:hypothetical protein B0H63DRAFT_485545 [Podospora didyma]
MVTMPNTTTSQSSHVGAGDDILAGLDEDELPNLFAFVRDAVRPGSRVSKCKPTSIDALSIFPSHPEPAPTQNPTLETKAPRYKCDYSPNASLSDALPLPVPSSPAAPPSLSSPTSQKSSIFLVIESISLATIRHIKSYLMAGTGIPSSALLTFWHFLDAFLDDSPSYNYLSTTASHLPSFPSATSREHHIKFLFNQYRELESRPAAGIGTGLTYGKAQEVAERGNWRCRVNYGLMEPCQRTDKFGVRTEFTPVLVERRHLAIWYDTAIASDQGWGLGIVLVDSLLDVGLGLGAKLAEPLFGRVVFGGGGRGLGSAAEDGISPEKESDRIATTSHKRCISVVARQLLNSHLSVHPKTHPAPAVLTECIYRIIAAEWMVVRTYCVRDINTIEWRLLGERGDGIKTQEQFEQVHVALFWMRRRLKRYLNLARSQQELCVSGGRIPWILHHARDNDTASASGAGANHEPEKETDVVMDFKRVIELLSDDLDCVQQIIEHINSLSSIQQGRMGVEEAGRSTEHNKLVLVLTVVATFLLPISTAATILGMEGDWAPGEARFAEFWAIAVPLSVVLVGVMMASMFAGQIFQYLRGVWFTTARARIRRMGVEDDDFP